MFNKFVFENHTFCDIMWKNVVQPDRLQMTAWTTCITCQITKATNTHSEYVILTKISTVTVVARTPHNVTLYLHCLDCCFFEIFVSGGTETPISKHNESSSSPSSFLGTIANNEMQAIRRRQGKLGQKATPTLLLVSR